MPSCTRHLACYDGGQTCRRAQRRAKRPKTVDAETLSGNCWSGATLNRPGLDRLRDRLTEATLDRVVIASPDRLARNYVHHMVLLEEFAQAGCRVEFLDQPLGTGFRQTISCCKSGGPWQNTNGR